MDQIRGRLIYQIDSGYFKPSCWYCKNNNKHNLFAVCLSGCRTWSLSEQIELSDGPHQERTDALSISWWDSSIICTTEHQPSSDWHKLMRRAAANNERADHTGRGPAPGMVMNTVCVWVCVCVRSPLLGEGGSASLWKERRKEVWPAE